MLIVIGAMTIRNRKYLLDFIFICQARQIFVKCGRDNNRLVYLACLTKLSFFQVQHLVERKYIQSHHALNFPVIVYVYTEETNLFKKGLDLS